MSLLSYDREFNNLALMDEEFLIALQEQKEREVYARITALDINELPIEYLEGNVQNGSISIDGSAAIRRTCSLTLFTENLNINDVYWGIKTKIKLEIGLKNNLDDNYGIDGNKYPEIIWFPQGVYLLTSFTTSIQTKGYSISLQGKDKMCMLNGDLSGNLYATVDFGTEEEEIKKFSPVAILDSNSEMLISQVYYIESPDSPDEVFISKPYVKMSYAFEENPEGTYYQINGYYKKITNTAGFKPRRYKIYKKVVSPTDIYEEIEMTEELYESGKFYYNPYELTSDSENQLGYYALDTRSKYSPYNTYWKLKQLYKIEYTTTKTKKPLRKIIQEAVHAFAGEPYRNIIINDLDEYGLEQLTYKGKDPVIAIRRVSDKEFHDLAMPSALHFFCDVGSETLELNTKVSGKTIDLDYLVKEKGVVLDELTDLELKKHPTTFYSDRVNRSDISKQFYLSKVTEGMDIGYRITDLTYTGDLITNLGDSLTTMLDKVIEMLGEFEYFYDLNGHFVFQQKRNFVNIAWTQITNNDDEDYVTFNKDSSISKFVYNFEGNRLITALQNAPKLNNIRNDFSIWGKRKGVNGKDIPIHARYAIDTKPKEYLAFDGILYYTAEALASPSPQTAIDFDLELDSDAIIFYEKNNSLIPTFLKDSNGESDWWEILDWANYYKAHTGVYPSQLLMAYCESGFTGTVAFDNETVRLNNRIIIDTNYSKPDYVIPFRETMIRPNGRKTLNWIPFQHGFHGCQHKYSEYLEMYDLNPGLRTFIYKPRLPSDEIIHQDGGDPHLPDIYVEKNALEVDWRELIYRMALDYFAAQRSEEYPIYDKDNNLVLDSPDDFLIAVAERNPYYYPTGQTGYEQYYTDMEGFWRQLYNPEYLPQPVWKDGHYVEEQVQKEGSVYYQKVRTWHDKEIDDFLIDYYFCPSENGIVYKQQREYFEGANAICKDNHDITLKYNKYKIGPKLIKDASGTTIENPDFNLRYWNTAVVEAPETLNFWIDFLDDAYELANYSVSLIGDRLKTVNDDKVRAIAYSEIPNLVIVSADKLDPTKSANEQLNWEQQEGAILDQVRSQSGYNFFWLPKGMSQFFNISYRGRSAKTKIEELLYTYSYSSDNITITALPLYHLEPNCRIYVRDDKTKINDEYIIDKITLPLDHKGTMSISATKAPSRIL